MRSKTLLVGVIGVVIGVLLVATGIVVAGSLNPSAGPTEAGSQMYTLEQIYTRLTGGGDATKMAAFTEPSSGPTAGTMHTLDELYALALPARVPKTGQTTSYATGDDGDLEKGVAWPNPRFTDNGNGTVTDNLTGLIWLKTANCFGRQSWATALASANALASGSCGLTDGSAAGDWRLPNLPEMKSLIDYTQAAPALPGGHPFADVQQSTYWASTTFAGFAGTTAYAWAVYLYNGNMNNASKDYVEYVWPLRGGQ